MYNTKPNSAEMRAPMRCFLILRASMTYAFIISSIISLSGCSKKDGNNPLTPPVSEVTKNGIISKTETWTETGKVYRVTADCSIEAPVTWGKGIVVAVDPAAVIRIGNSGVLTIQENVTVKLREGAYIEAGELSPGTLIATGSASAPIFFKADMGAQAWGLNSASRSGGIVLGDSANNSRLSFCTITGAVAGIYVKAGSPFITHCKISSCKGNGIYFDSAAGPADSSTFTKDTISGCGGYPLTLPADKLGNFSGEVVFSGPQGDKNAIHVLGTQVEDSAAIWRKKALPYVFNGTTIISSFMRTSCVTIMPGVVCTFEKNACIKVGDPRFGSGILIAKGAPADSIIFVNSLPDSVWGDETGGIWIGPESPVNTVLEFCSIQNATTGIFVHGGVTVTVSHCRVTGCRQSGMTFDGGGPVDSLAFQGNFCVKNAGYGISITADQLVNLSGISSVAGNGKGGIYIMGSEVWQSGTWKKYDAPYVVDGVIDIGSSDGVEIGIYPGAEFNFLPGAYIRVGNSNPGTLIANGTGNVPIVFASSIQGAYWGAGADGATGGGIRIEKFAGAKTELKCCKIQNATSGVYVDANVKIQSCIFNDNHYYGLIRDKNAAPALISGNTYFGNGKDSMYVAP
jgi:nitrous oxidase accessory protein NosD